jgi:hypothetical protein
MVTRHAFVFKKLIQHAIPVEQVIACVAMNALLGLKAEPREADAHDDVVLIVCPIQRLEFASSPEPVIKLAACGEPIGLYANTVSIATFAVTRGTRLHQAHFC